MWAKPERKEAKIMAKITIAGDSYVITSAKTLEDIKTLEKYRPKALQLFETDDDGSKECVFCVGSTNGNGTINQYGASFGGVTHDDAKLATITLALPRDCGDAKKWVADKIGAAKAMLDKVEGQIDRALAEVKAEQDEVMKSITVAQ